jgi:hypothetical protein
MEKERGNRKEVGRAEEGKESRSLDFFFPVSLLASSPSGLFSHYSFLFSS